MFGENLQIAVPCFKTALFPDYAGSDMANCEVKDLSRDSLVIPGSPGGTSLNRHMVVWSWEPINNETNATAGWQVIVSESTRYPLGGETIPFTVEVKATPLVERQDFDFLVHVDYTDSNTGYTNRTTIPFHTEVNQYDFAVVAVTQATKAQRVGQDDIVRYTVEVANVGVYPDSYAFSIKADPDLGVTTPPNLYVPPGETRTTVVTLLTPHDKLYEIGRSTSILIKVNSVTGSGVYSTVGVLQIRGLYLPTYWIPLLLVGLVSMGVLVRGSREKALLAKAERGRPRRVELTPRQAVVLAELRRTDPDAYKEKRASLDSVYRERLSDYRGHRKERAAADAEEARQARAEFLAAKKARKAKRAEEKREAKRQRAEQARQAKLDKRDAKREAKLVKKKEKILAKTRAKLEKKQAKEAKKQAKLDAAQARADAKAAKKAEKQARKKKE